MLIEGLGEACAEMFVHACIAQRCGNLHPACGVIGSPAVLCLCPCLCPCHWPFKMVLEGYLNCFCSFYIHKTTQVWYD